MVTVLCMFGCSPQHPTGGVPEAEVEAPGGDGKYHLRWWRGWTGAALEMGVHWVPLRSPRTRILNRIVMEDVIYTPSCECACSYECVLELECMCAC